VPTLSAGAEGELRRPPTGLEGEKAFDANSAETGDAREWLFRSRLGAFLVCSQRQKIAQATSMMGWTRGGCQSTNAGHATIITILLGYDAVSQRAAKPAHETASQRRSPLSMAFLAPLPAPAC
jgi:hypothetical protein